MQKDTLVIFDFDGTITTEDTINHFCAFHAGKLRVIMFFITQAYSVLKYMIGTCTNARIKSMILNAFFGGMPYAEFVNIAERYADMALPFIENGACIKKIEWHKSQKHRIAIVSASPKEWIIPWAKKYGIEDIIASEMEIIDDIVTGNISEEDNCYGANKLAFLRKKISNFADYYIYSYADSRSDAAILSIADKAFYRRFE